MPTSSSFGYTQLEMHSGAVAGRTRTPRRIDADPDLSARAALELVLREHLATGSCVVKFSGGRDSSLVLAIAARVARREGVEPPTALSIRYAGIPELDEADWQDLVVRHVGCRHEVVTVEAGDDELAGPLAVSRLLTYGPLLPPPGPLTIARIADRVRGCTVLTGEGGDEVLGASRISGVALWRTRQRPSSATVRRLAGETMPLAVRRRAAYSAIRAADLFPWLTPNAMDLVTAQLVDDQVNLPWDWREARWRILESRAVAAGDAATSAIAEAEGHRLAHPLTDPRFVAALCHEGGRFGFADRTAIMRRLAGDILPDSIIGRRSKVYFNRVYASSRVRDFARSWNGCGVDTSLVDVERLRAAWTADFTPAFALAPLQLALLAASRAGWRPPPNVGSAG